MSDELPGSGWLLDLGTIHHARGVLDCRCASIYQFTVCDLCLYRQGETHLLSMVPIVVLRSSKASVWLLSAGNTICSLELPSENEEYLPELPIIADGEVSCSQSEH